MNPNQIQSFVRSVLLGLGAALVAKGTLSDSQLQEIIGGVLSLASVLWSQFHHKDTPSA